MPVLTQGSFGHALRRALERRHAGEAIDPLAEHCASEALQLLERAPPDIFAAYVALEVAAAREPDIFGPTYRLFREFVMRSVTGAARRSGIEANIAETTTQQQWIGRGSSSWRARLVDGRLWIETDVGQTRILDPDLGMTEGYDA
jgi:hypothetical protein